MAGYAEIDQVRMQGYALADRQIEVGLCAGGAGAVASWPGGGRAECRVPAATVSAAR